MTENNPIMLWALQKGAMYWILSVIKFFLALFLWYIYPKSKIGVYILIVIFAFVWIQFFVGYLV